jgi:hypothetical protein
MPVCSSFEILMCSSFQSTARIKPACQSNHPRLTADHGYRSRLLCRLTH